MLADKEIVVRRLFDEVLNHGNMATADELVARESTDSTPSMIGVSGLEGFKASVTLLRGALPDLQYTIETLLSAGDEVAVYWSAQGTMSGTFRGHPPTGKHATVTGAIIYCVADGQIQHSRGSWDALGLFLQLGLLPESAMSGITKPG
jgi:predicted ester cyclase